MSELLQIITKPDELREMLSGMLASLPAAQLPPEVVELEVLRRREYLTTDEVAKVFPISSNSLRKRRSQGEGPAWIKDGERVFYKQQAVREYLDARRQKTIDQP